MVNAFGFTPDERNKYIMKRKTELINEGIDSNIAEAMAIGEVDTGMVKPVLPHGSIGVFKY